MKAEFDTLIKPYITPSKPVQITNEEESDYALGHVLPEYLTVDVKDPVRQWKINHESEMFEQLISSQKELRESQHSFKREISNMLRKVPIDLITRDFLNKEKLTIEARAYIIDKVLPIVVLGLEKVLMEADHRGLVEKVEIDPNYNPINFLAQYLMRNNPLFANFNEASPYVRGLRQVVEELKVEIFQQSDNKLARLKAEALTKRDEREKEEARKKREARRRIEIYQQLFDQFLVRGHTAKVDYDIVHSSIRTFSDVVSLLVPDISSRATPIITNQYHEKKDTFLSRKDFGLLISHYADEMPLDIFDQFAEHLSKCAKLYQAQMEKDSRKKLLSELFMTCDLDEMGLLDRKRILMLFDQFYAQTPDNVKIMLRDPRHWPICDYKREKDTGPKDEQGQMNTDGNINNINNDNELENDHINAKENETLELSSENVEVIKEINENSGAHFDEIDEDNERDEGNEESEQTKENGRNEESEQVKEKEENEESEQTKEKEESEENEETKEKERNEENEQVKEKEENEKSEQTKEKEGNEENEQTKEKEGNEDKDEREVNNDNQENDEAQGVKEKDESSTSQLQMLNSSDRVYTSKDSDPEIQSTDAPKMIVRNIEEDDHGEKSKSPEKEVTESMGKTSRIESIAEDNYETTNDLVDIETRSLSGEEDAASEQPEHAINREITKLSTMTTMSTPYDEDNITFPQFFQVTEEFLGDSPNIQVLDDLIEFLREGYQETVEERLKRLQKAHRQVISARRKNVIDDLFNVWDRDNAGFLSMKEISDTLSKYRNGLLIEGTKAAKKEARMRQIRVTKDVRITRKDFRTFIYTIARVSDMLNDESEVETMVHYFIGLIQRTYEEKLRGEARKKWLNSISWAAEISCGSMDGVYRAVFQALYKDAEVHGAGKIISASVALLENNEFEVQKRGMYTLHFVASTSDQEEYVVGKKLDKSMKNISFQAVYTGNIVSLIHASGSDLVVYFNPCITESAKEGSLVIVPIKDDLQRVYGTLSVDTLNDPNPDKAVFFSYEIAFFQGVSKQFSTAFQHVEMLRLFVKISDSAMTWICRRTESVKGANLYLREKKDQKNVDEFMLRHVLSANERGEVNRFTKPTRIDKGDNLFKMYLFDTIETSQATTADAYGDRNISIPLRDLDGVAVAVMEINIGTMKSLPSAENTEVAKMMDLLQQAFDEIIKVNQLIDIKVEEANLNGEDQSPEAKASLVPACGRSNVDILFDQYMLAELRANVARLDAQAYAEIKSYKDPPITIHAIIQASLALLYPKEGHLGQFENWEKCKKYISMSLSKLILAFDPFGDASMIPMKVIHNAMNKIPRSEIDKHSSKPALDLYNWVSCCVTLIDHCIHNV